MNREPTPSPCINVCRLDRDTGLCRGCCRTGAEIAAWRDASEEARLRIIDRIAERRRRAEGAAGANLAAADAG